MAPYPFSLSRFSPPPPSLFSPVTQLRKSVSVKLLLRRGGRSRKAVRGREGKMAPSPFSLSRFSPSSPSLFPPVTRPAKRVSMKTKVNSLKVGQVQDRL